MTRVSRKAVDVYALTSMEVELLAAAIDAVMALNASTSGAIGERMRRGQHVVDAVVNEARRLQAVPK